MFNSFNRSSGKDLNWFFNNWFFSNVYIDLAITSVSGSDVTIQNIGGMAAPVDLVVMYDDSTSEKFHQTSAIWQRDPKSAVVKIPSGKKIKTIVLDGGIWMDANEADNRWEAK
jgi:hypothetical protein